MEFERLKDCVFELLYQHNCVIIPGFGGFITNYKDAGFEESRNFICPPRQRVAFNQNLNQNDGLLVNHWSINNAISYQEALIEIESFSSYLKNKIQDSKSFDFKGIGTFYLNQEKNLLFLPFQGLNFMQSSFGLEPLKIKILTIVPSGVLVQNVTESKPLDGDTYDSHVLIKKNKPYRLRQYLKYAAFILFLFVSVATLLMLKQKSEDKTVLNNIEGEQNASLLNPDSNFNNTAHQSENKIIIPEYTTEREQLIEIKTKLADLSKGISNNHESFKVITGYYGSEIEAGKVFIKLKKQFEHAEVRQNSQGEYFIHIETFYKHTTAEDFSVMLEQMGFKDTKVEKEII